MASCPPIYAWADNKQHMDPCKVASSLRDVCDSSLSPLQPINPEDSYTGPTTKLQSSCMCSSVIYALESACSDCQSGRIVSWPIWSSNCTSPSVSSFERPLPSNISVPGWAYFDVKLDPIYSRSAASSSAVASLAIPTSVSISASAIEAPAHILPTSTSTFQTASTDTSTLSKSGLTSLETASFGSDPPSHSATTGNRAAAIAGGTIAAVVLLAMGAALAYWYIRRRRRTRIPPSVAYMALHGTVY